jgi:superfamily II DNA or RNA helicase
MKVKKTRDNIQNECLQILLKHKRATAAISMGVGKTLIGLKYLEKFWNDGTIRSALVVAPKLSIFDTWTDDAAKFGINKVMMHSVTFTTYLSLNKLNPNDYDIVVLDECHSLLYTHEIFLSQFTGRILGLTGTPPRYHNSEKGTMVFKYCPMMYTYITDDAVDDEILNDYRIIVHMMPLSDKLTLPVNSKNGGVFYTSEKKSYDYWSKRLATTQSKKEEQICSVMRMRAMMDFRTKESYAKYLLAEIEDKCLVFANTQDQAERICKNAIHSNNPDSEELLQKFKDGEIEEASCVLQLNEGINIPNLRAGIILHAYGNERKSSQRIGRLLRLNPTETAIVHILCYKDTVDERWVREALKDLDPKKIKYHEVNIQTHDTSLHR